MDFAYDTIMDTALNAVGYLAAGALAVVLYLMFGRRSAARGRSSADDEGAGECAPQVDSTKQNGSVRPQFVSLSQLQTDRRERTGPHAKRAVYAPRDVRNERARVFQVARQMLKAGETADRIQQVLPISQAELALLNLGRNR